MANVFVIFFLVLDYPVLLQSAKILTVCLIGKYINKCLAGNCFVFSSVASGV